MTEYKWRLKREPDELYNESYTTNPDYFQLSNSLLSVEDDIQLIVH